MQKPQRPNRRLPFQALRSLLVLPALWCWIWALESAPGPLLWPISWALHASPWKQTSYYLTFQARQKLPLSPKAAKMGSTLQIRCTWPSTVPCLEGCVRSTNAISSIPKCLLYGQIQPGSALHAPATKPVVWKMFSYYKCNFLLP